MPAGKFKIVQRQHKQVVPGIWRFINEQQSDVLAITIREREFLETLFHDSVSEKFLYQHQLPLLALPEKAILPLPVAPHPEKVTTGA